MLLSNSNTTITSNSASIKNADLQSSSSSSTTTPSSLSLTRSAFISSPIRFNANNANTLITRLASREQIVEQTANNTKTSSSNTNNTNINNNNNNNSNNNISATTSSSPLVAKYLNNNPNQLVDNSHQQKALNTVLNPDGYLSTKLNVLSISF